MGSFQFLQNATTHAASG